jgi:hypothetical protein
MMLATAGMFNPDSFSDPAQPPPPPAPVVSVPSATGPTKLADRLGVVATRTKSRERQRAGEQVAAGSGQAIVVHAQHRLCLAHGRSVLGMASSRCKGALRAGQS